MAPSLVSKITYYFYAISCKTLHFGESSPVQYKRQETPPPSMGRQHPLLQPIFFRTQKRPNTRPLFYTYFAPLRLRPRVAHYGDVEHAPGGKALSTGGVEVCVAAGAQLSIHNLSNA